MAPLANKIPSPLKVLLRPAWRALRRGAATLRKRPSSHTDWIRDLKRISPSRSFEVVFDVGASRGQTTQVFLECFPTARIYAFEPIPEIAAVARERHKSKSSVIVECAALDESSGVRTFHVNAFSETSSLLASAAPHEGRAYLNTSEKIRIPSVSLDDYCVSHDIQAIDLLKLDVQGCELAVLKGARRMLGRVASIFAEVLFARYYDGQCEFYHLEDTLRQNGFWLYRLYHFDYGDDGRLLQADGLWLNKMMFPQDGRPLDQWEKKLNAKLASTNSRLQGLVPSSAP